MLQPLKILASVTILLVISSYAISQELNTATAQKLLRQASSLLPGVPEMQQMSVASNIANSQVRAGDLAGALSTVHLLKKPEDVASAMGNMAYALDSSGELPAALQLIRDEPAGSSKGVTYEQIAVLHAEKGDFPGALRIAHLIGDDPGPSVQAFTRIAQLQWKSGDQAGADTVWNEALEVVEKARKKDPNYANLLVDVAMTRGEVGDTAAAYNDLDKLKNLIAQRRPPDQGLLSTLAMGYAALGDTANALHTVEALVPGSNRDICLSTISNQLLKKNDTAGAEEIVSHISDPELKANAFRELTMSQAAAGRPGSALEMAEKIPSLAARAEALATLALEQAEHGDNAATETLMHAIAIANESKPKPSDQVFATIAVVEAMQGDFHKAQATTQNLSSEARPWAWWNITEMMVNTGNLTTALEIAAQETDSYSKAYALLGAANGILDQLRREEGSKDH